MYSVEAVMLCGWEGDHRSGYASQFFCTPIRFKCKEGKYTAHGICHF